MLWSYSPDPTFNLASLRKLYVRAGASGLLRSLYSQAPFNRVIFLQKKEAEEKIEQIKNSGGDMSADYKPPAQDHYDLRSSDK